MKASKATTYIGPSFQDEVKAFFHAFDQAVVETAVHFQIGVQAVKEILFGD